jgi:AcrR family transcriptional regulator
MKSRTYTSPLREASAAKKRDEVVHAAIIFLREEATITSFSIDAIAKKANVTRLTIYNQFGSRRGLLEAAFDELSNRSQLSRLLEVVRQSDTQNSLDQIVEIFCNFWSSDPAVGRLHDAMKIDSEFEIALNNRNERRRDLITHLVTQLLEDKSLRIEDRETVDFIFTMTSYAVFSMLSANRSKSAACKIIKSTCSSAFENITKKLDRN